MEAAGVEPASGNAFERASTRVGTPFRVSRSSAAADQRAQQASFVSTSMHWQVRRSSLIVSVFCGYRRKLQTPSLPGFIRQREQQRCCHSQLQDCPFLRGLGRHDARLERPHPRRNRYAPLSKIGLHYTSSKDGAQHCGARDVIRDYVMRCRIVNSVRRFFAHAFSSWCLSSGRLSP